jgi:hypothetical protein
VLTFLKKNNLTAEFSNIAITIGAAGEDDIDQIVLLYDNLKIDSSNYKLRLDPEGEQSFSRIGGFFHPLDKKSIRRVIEENCSCVITVKRAGKIIAFLWVSSTDPVFSKYKPDDTQLKFAIDNGKTAYFRGILSSKMFDISSKIIPITLINTAVKLLVKEGYTHSLAEIYRVIYYNDGVHRNVDIINEKGLHKAIAAGGKYIGELPDEHVTVDGIKIGARSSVILFEHVYAQQLLDTKMNTLGIKIGGLQ